MDNTNETSQSRASYTSNYTSNGGMAAMADRTKEVAKDVADQSREIGEQALDAIDEWLQPTGLSLKERPVTTLAVFGGLALSLGAIWMARRNEKTTRIDQLVDQLSDLARRARWS